MLALMTSAYTALKNGVPCAVSRAWPNRDPILPSLSFRLLSWKKQEDGSALAVFAVQIRALSPQQGDELAAQAETALSALGFSLFAASDEVEDDTGFPIKSLEFSAVLGGAAVAPLTLFILVSGAYCPVNGLSVIRAEPGERPLLPDHAVSRSADSFFPGRRRAERLFASGVLLPGDTGQAQMASAFASGAPVPFRLERGALSSQFQAHVCQFSALPAGFFAGLQLIP